MDLFFLKFSLFEISFKIQNFKMKKTLLKELLLQNQEVCRMEISKLRPFLDPKFEDVKRRWKQDYSKKYWVISLSQREIRGKLIFTVLIDVFYLFLETSVFYDKTWQVETVDNSHLYTHCLEMKCCLAGSSKTATRILIFFSTAKRAKPSFYMKCIAT